jgi:predicted nucleotidyltransferase
MQLTQQAIITQLSQALATVPELELAVLVGSQANGSATAQSDWDIAIRWANGTSLTEQLALEAKLAKLIAKTLAIHHDKIDLIQLTAAKLAMREVVANQGVPLKGEQTLAWFHFLTQTWAEVEDFYWRKNHAA